MTWAQLCKLGSKLPAVTVDTWYGTPALKVAGKGFVRLKEDGKSVVFMLESVDEQQFLITQLSKIYFITDHYKNYGAVLAWLTKLTVPEAKRRLERTWRLIAPAKVLKQLTGA